MTGAFGTIGIFDACGRVRSAEARGEASARRSHDDALASRCLSLGLDPYRSAEVVTAVDILSQGSLTADLGVPLSRRRFFNTIAASDNQQILRLAESYFSFPEQPKVYELILRPKMGKPLTSDYRRQHKDHVQQVGAACREIKRLGLGRPIFIARHPRPIGNGHAIDLHTHLLIESTDDSVDALIVFAAEQFSTDERGFREVSSPVGLVAYLVDPNHWRMTDDTDATFDVALHIPGSSAGVLAQEVRLPRRGRETGFDDQSFVTFWNETSALRWWEVVGPLRDFRRENVPPRHKLVQNALGEVVVVPKPHKPRRVGGPILRFTPGPIALAARMSWINEVLRPVILVTGWRGSWVDLASRYDLSRIVHEAQTAWDTHPSELERVAQINSMKLSTRKKGSDIQNAYWLASRGTPWNYRDGPPPWS